MSLGGMLNLAGGGGQKPKPKPKKNTIAQKAADKNASRSAAALTGLSSTNPLAKQKQEPVDLGAILKKAAGVMPVAPPKTKKQQVSDQEDAQFQAFQESIGVKNPPARPSKTQIEQWTKGSLPWVMKQLDADSALKMTPEQRETVANVLRYRQLRDLGDGQFDPDIKVNVFDPVDVKGKVRNEDVLDVLRLLKNNPAALEMELAGHKATRDQMAAQVRNERAGMAGAPFLANAEAGVGKRVTIDEKGQIKPYDPYDETYIGKLGKNLEESSARLNQEIYKTPVGKAVLDAIDFVDKATPSGQLFMYSALAGETLAKWKGEDMKKAMENSGAPGLQALAPFMDKNGLGSLNKLKHEFIKGAPGMALSFVPDTLLKAGMTVDPDPRMTGEKRFWAGMETALNLLGSEMVIGAMKAGKGVAMLHQVEQVLDAGGSIGDDVVKQLEHQIEIPGVLGDLEKVPETRPKQRMSPEEIKSILGDEADSDFLSDYESRYLDMNPGATVQDAREAYAWSVKNKRESAQLSDATTKLAQDLKERRAEGAKGKETTKNEWEMTMDEYVDAHPEMTRQQAVFSHRKEVTKAANEGKDIPKEVLHQVPNAAPHKMTKAEFEQADFYGYNYDVQAKSHFDWVWEALKRGDKVPDEVLADYPQMVEEAKRIGLLKSDPAKVEYPKNVHPYTGETVLGEVRMVDPDELFVNPDVQYKSGTNNASRTTNKFKDINVYDVHQGGTLTAWERLDGRLEIAHGHHRAELAKRAEKFIIPGKGQAFDDDVQFLKDRGYLGTPDKPVVSYHPQTGVPYLGELEMMKADDIKVHPKIQWKSDTNNAARVTGDYKDIKKYNVHQGGVLTVFEDLQGDRYAGHGHHRRDMAINAEDFVMDGPHGQVSVDRVLPVRVLKESDGWTVDRVKLVSAIENLRNGDGKPLDAVRVLRDMGARDPEQLKELGIAIKGALQRDTHGLMSLSEDGWRIAAGLDGVDGHLSPSAAAGVGASGVDKSLHSKILQRLRSQGGNQSFEAARAKAIQFEQSVEAAKRKGIKVNTGGMFDDDPDWAPVVETLDEQSDIESRARNMVLGQYSELKRGLALDPMDGEHINEVLRRQGMEEMATGRRDLAGRLGYIFERDEPLIEMRQDLAAKVKNGELTTEAAAKEYGRAIVERVKTATQGEIIAGRRLDSQPLSDAGLGRGASEGAPKQAEPTVEPVAKVEAPKKVEEADPFGDQAKPTEAEIEASRAEVAEAKAEKAKAKKADEPKPVEAPKEEPKNPQTSLGVSDSKVDEKPKPVRVVDKASFEKGLREHFGLNDEEVAAVSAITEARAKGWAKDNNGKNPEDWYAKHWEGVTTAGDEVSQVVLQKNKGAVRFKTDGRAVLVAMTKPDVTTVLHEVGHVFGEQLPESEIRMLEKLYGLNHGEWGLPISVVPENRLKDWTAAKEKFARSFERYLYDGVVPHKGLQAVFEKLKDWFRNVYRSLKGSEIAIDVNPKLRNVFDRLLNEDGYWAKYDPTVETKAGADGTEILFKDTRYFLTTGEKQNWDRLVAAQGADVRRIEDAMFKERNQTMKEVHRVELEDLEREHIRVREDWLANTQEFQRRVEKRLAEDLDARDPRFRLDDGGDLSEAAPVEGGSRPDAPDDMVGVRGYVRADGTEVRGHIRALPGEGEVSEAPTPPTAKSEPRPESTLPPKTTYEKKSERPEKPWWENDKRPLYKREPGEAAPGELLRVLTDDSMRDVSIKAQRYKNSYGANLAEAWRSKLPQDIAEKLAKSKKGEWSGGVTGEAGSHERMIAETLMRPIYEAAGKEGKRVHPEAAALFPDLAEKYGWDAAGHEPHWWYPNFEEKAPKAEVKVEEVPKAEAAKREIQFGDTVVVSSPDGRLQTTANVRGVDNGHATLWNGDGQIRVPLSQVRAATEAEAANPLGFRVRDDLAAKYAETEAAVPEAAKVEAKNVVDMTEEELRKRYVPASFESFNQGQTVRFALDDLLEARRTGSDLQEQLADFLQLRADEITQKEFDLRAAARDAKEAASKLVSVEEFSKGDSYKAYAKRVRNEMTVEELRESLKFLTENQKEVKAELSRMTIPQLKEITFSFYAKSKSDWVNSAYNSLLHLHNPSDTLTVAWGESTEGVLKKVLDDATQETVDAYRESKKAAATAEAERIKKSLENPETVEEYKTFIRVKGKDALTPEQRATYEDLVATSNRESRKASDYVGGVQSDEAKNVELEIVKHYHSKREKDVFIVKMGDRVSAEAYQEMNRKAKQLGGWYSRPYQGSPGGFAFESEESAAKFVELQKGSVSRADELAAKAEVKAEKRSSKLRTVAESLEAKANEVLNADRKTNTARRADMASAMEDRAQKDLAMAKTMKNLADAIESGEAKHLEKISAGTHVETLDQMLRGGRRERITQEKLPYQSMDGKPLEMADIDYVKFPKITVYPTAFKSAFNEVLRGTKGNGNLVKALDQMVRASGENPIWIDLKTWEAIEAGFKKANKKMNQWTAEMGLLPKRLHAIGITNDVELRAALREYLQFKEGAKAADPVKAAERALIGAKIPGYFPTPEKLAQRVIDEAGIQPGMIVLEPSAGKGSLAELARAAGGEVKAIEVNSRLRDILTSKEFPLVGDDFLQHSGEYDRIVMNPPFENGQDIDHVQHAFGQLTPGGRMVAIMSEGPFFRSDKKATAFREWLEQVNGVSEKLPEGSFKDSDNSTGVATRLVTIDKSEVPMAPGAPAKDTLYQREWNPEAKSEVLGWIKTVLKENGGDGLGAVKYFTAQGLSEAEAVNLVLEAGGRVKKGLGLSKESEALDLFDDAADQGALFQSANSRQDENGFYLKSARIIDQKMGGAMAPNELENMLRNNGVTQDELDWTGLGDLIRDSKGRLSKASVEKWIDDNSVKIEIDAGREITKRQQELKVQWSNINAELEKFPRQNLKEYERDIIEAFSWREPEKLEKIQENARAGEYGEDAKKWLTLQDESRSIMLEMEKEKAPGNKLKYGEYTVGNKPENYREVLIKGEAKPDFGDEGIHPQVMEKHKAQFDELATKYKTLTKQLHVNMTDAIVEERSAVLRAQSNLVAQMKKESLELAPRRRVAPGPDQHFDAQTIVHVRSSDREIDGRKSYFLEEVQSDRHQEARKSGGDAGAPFAKNWSEVAMRQSLRTAVEEGYDSLSWTEGNIHARRYNQLLAENVGKIEVSKVMHYEGEAPHRNIVVYDKNGNVQQAFTNRSSLGTQELLGKDLSDKIWSNENRHVIDDFGDAIGGEGFRQFYDKAIPSYMKKYVKKWGAEVKPTTMKVNGEDVKVWEVEITPEMRRSVMDEGQSLFQSADPVNDVDGASSLFGDDVKAPDELKVDHSKKVIAENPVGFAKAKAWFDATKTKLGSNVDQFATNFGSPMDRLRNIGEPGSEANLAGRQLAAEIEKIDNLSAADTVVQLDYLFDPMVKKYGRNWELNKKVQKQLEELAKAIDAGDASKIEDPDVKELYKRWTNVNAAFVRAGKERYVMVDTLVNDILKPHDWAAANPLDDAAQYKAMQNEEFWKDQQVGWYDRDANGTARTLWGRVHKINEDSITLMSDEGLLYERDRYLRLSRTQAVDPKNYFPRSLDKDFLNQMADKQGPKYEAYLETVRNYVLDNEPELAKRLGDLAENVRRNAEAQVRRKVDQLTQSLFDVQGIGDAVTAGPVRLERVRLPFRLPDEFYNWNFADVTRTHVQNSVRRLRMAETWGHDGSAYAQSLSKLSNDAEQLKKYNDLIKQALGHAEPLDRSERMLSGLVAWEGAYQVTTKLTGLTSTVKQLNQMASTYSVLGFKAGQKAMNKAIVDLFQGREELMKVVRSGAIQSVLLDAMAMRDYSKAARLVSDIGVTITGLKPVDAALRVHGAIAGRMAVEDLIKGLKIGPNGIVKDAKYRLLSDWFLYTDADIAEMAAKKTLNYEQEVMAYHGGAKTQIRNRPSETPAMLKNSPIWRVVTRFQMYNYGQSKILTYALHEARKGNPAPLLKMAATYAAMGWITGTLNEKIKAAWTGKKEGKRDGLVDELQWSVLNSGMLGIFGRPLETADALTQGDDEVNGAEYSRALEKGIEQLPVPPLLSDVTKAVGSAAYALKNNLGPLQAADDFARNTIVPYGRFSKRTDPDYNYIKRMRRDLTKQFEGVFSKSDIDTWLEKYYQTPAPRWATPEYKEYNEALRLLVDPGYVPKPGEPGKSRSAVMDKLGPRPDPFGRVKKPRVSVPSGRIEGLTPETLGITK